jgi:hypothetical protein
MPPDVWHEVTRLQTQVLVRWGNLLKEGIDLVGADTPAGARLSTQASFIEFLNKEMPALLARWDTSEGEQP